MTHTFDIVFWHAITRLGEALILIPAAVVLMAWLVLRSHDARMALCWLGAVTLAALLTTVTKVAFIGWGLGIARIDFTGVSGHTMFAAAIYPLLARTVVADAGRRAQFAATAMGVTLAVLIGVSRVQVNAHSWSEVIAGLTVGFAATATATMLAHVPRAHPPRWLLAAVLAWFVAMPMAAPPSPTHGLVVRLALALSGRDVPYTRDDLHRPAVMGTPAALI